jgi:hypothetical protein
MVDAVQAIQAAIEMVGRLRNLSKKMEDAEFKMLLADLSGDLADAKVEVASLKVEIARLTQENQALAERLAQRDASKPTFSDGAYRFEGEEGHFCTACFDVRQRRVRLTRLEGSFRTFGRWECPSCKAILS